MDSTRARLHLLKRVFGSRSTAGRVATPQDLSVTKQHRNDRWDRCTASAGDWQIITTTSHRSANQRYFMHNSATVHGMRMQSSALDSSRSQLCNDTSTGVVRHHQITKQRRLQKVVSYDVLHHSVQISATVGDAVTSSSASGRCGVIVDVLFALSLSLVCACMLAQWMKISPAFQR